ncbi:hypothetical protein AST13_02230 [Staphylococcus xylosus]|uniref:hypothetical protein n=1 Tax=Staphylococcus xylosus TaxID=1288 RepID=UPI000852A442|nr:hypothetical protein [Staphylococcus xylosus]OEL06876.1 hypothetical protein AST13_02230 [Staphylococcus xylosus]
MFKFFLSHIEIIISLFALLVSYLTYKRNKLKYQYQFAANCYSPKFITLVNPEDIYDTKTYPDSIITNLHFINLSNFDIGYFELTAFDNTNKKYLDLLTVNSISFTEKHKQPLELIPISKEEVRHKHLQLPKYKYGTFKAKEMTYLDIVVFPSENTKSVTIEFELPKKRIINIKPKTIHNKFVKCGVHYNITDWQDKKTTNSKDK